jgi:integrase
MAKRLTDAIVKALPKPEQGNRITYDSDVKGFGCRVTAAGARSFVLSYRTTTGRERRYTIGQFPAWKTTAARAEAAELKKLVDRGGDPLGAIEEARAAPTVADMCERYETEHLPKKRETSARADRLMIAKYIPTTLKHKRVAAVSFSDVDGLHRKITAAGTPIRANRVVALLGKMFSLAIRWGWRADNPAKGIELNPENKRERYLGGDELARLTQALAAHPDQTAANVIRLLLLTGARRGEVLSARWDHFDLTTGVWTKPSSHTKQKKIHRVPLSGPARQLLADLYAARTPDAAYIFPSGRSGQHREGIRRAWTHVCGAAGISGVHVHDLRHSYASILASSGLSLHVVGALLGHTQPRTTARYAHLFDDALRAATERVGAIVSGKPAADVVPLKGGAA